MMTKVQSAACLGIKAYPVQIEVDVSFGLPQFIVVGLPDASIKESRERVRSAIKNSGYRFPPEKITINLAPADIKKEGAGFDLPIALGILAVSGVIPPETLSEYIFLGELALDGSIRPFKGAIVIASGLKEEAHPPGGFVFPKDNAAEASLEENAKVYPVETLTEVVRFLTKEIEISASPLQSRKKFTPHHPESMDFSEIKGQFFAKRAIEIAVAGRHNLLLIGPPGAGKSMLSSRIPTLLPDLAPKEALEITKIYSVTGLINGETLIRERPFRSPHPSISSVAFAGGGSWPKPGEISLAHAGVLFLDEFPEFRRDILETLRGPLETGEITIARAKSQVTYPAGFFLVAAMNPCPCGYLSDPRKPCRCSPMQIQKYQSKVSGPILDRIDLHVEVPAVPFEILTNAEPAESSAAIRERIVRCREIQTERYKESPVKVNALMRAKDMRQFAKLNNAARRLLEMAMKELRLSARAYYKILKIARTIADLAETENIEEEHVGEAIQYRSLDRQWWS